jgi:predicted amidohydrolase
MLNSQNFIAACVQLNSQNNLTDNLEKINKFVSEAAQAGASFITLPENAFFMAENHVELFQHSPKMLQHNAIIVMQKLAQQHKIWLLFTLAVQADELADKLANRSVLISPEGEIASHYDKIHLFDANVKGDQTYQESKNAINGSKAVIADLPWGKLGQTICYDLRFPHLFRALAKNGAKFITVPAAFTYKTGQAHWHSLLRARAIENACYIIAPAQCGMHPKGRRTYGHSLIINPWGEILSEGTEEMEGVIVAKIEPEMVDDIRANLPSLNHDREFSFE